MKETAHVGSLNCPVFFFFFIVCLFFFFTSFVCLFVCYSPVLSVRPLHFFIIYCSAFSRGNASIFGILLTDDDLCRVSTFQVHGSFTSYLPKPSVSPFPRLRVSGLSATERATSCMFYFVFCCCFFVIFVFVCLFCFVLFILFYLLFFCLFCLMF